MSGSVIKLDVSESLLMTSNDVTINLSVRTGVSPKVYVGHELLLGSKKVNAHYEEKWRWDLRTQRALIKCWDLYNNSSSVLLWMESKPKSKAFDFTQFNKVQIVGMVLRMEISTIAWSQWKDKLWGSLQEAPGASRSGGVVWTQIALHVVTYAWNCSYFGGWGRQS